MDLSNLQLSIEEGVALITVDRPKALNALDRATLNELDGLLDMLRANDSVRVLILTGSGEKAFVAGADIKELASLSPLAANEHAVFGQSVFNKLESLGKPSIAAINGFALGGGLELAMACTIRLAGAKARMGLPEITLGLIPGFGGTQRLSRLVGPGHSMQMVLSGAMVNAERAEKIGLVTEVFEGGELLNAARGLASTMVGFSAVTLRLAEETVRRGREMPFAEALGYEAAQFGVAASTADAAEGMAAFSEKRKAEFQGR